MTEERHSIPQIGLSIEIRRDWPLESLIEADRGNTYQIVADTGGIVFVLYGPEETVDSFISRLSDMITRVTVRVDEQTTCCGEKARHVVLIAETKSLGVYRHRAGKGLVHGQTPATSTYISVVGFNRGGVPVLVGYRLPEAHLAAYQDILDRMAESIAVMEK